MTQFDEQQINDDFELLDKEISVDDVAVDPDIPMSDEEAFAYKIVKRAAMLRGVSIDRGVFLRTELSKKCPPDVVATAVETSPREAGISPDVIDELADAAIAFETRKAAGLSLLAGIPGGLALFGTIPADLMQYFAHSLRIEQKLAYLYGWGSFLDDEDEIDDETMARLILFLGIMMQVGGVSTSLTKFAATTARAGVAKTIERQALTKTAWYTPMKQVLRVIGVKVTKNSFAEVVAKGVPILGGAVSGGITYATFLPEATRLKNYLRRLTPATGTPLTDAEVEAIAEQVEEESKTELDKALESAAGAVTNAAANVGITEESIAATAGAARDMATDAAKAAGDVAAGAARAAGDGIRRGFGGLTSMFGSKQRPKPASSTKSSSAVTEDAMSQLRMLKSLLDEGILTQEEFDAKKKELLGL